MDYDWRFSNWDKMSKGISPSSYPKKEIILLYSPKIICSFVQPRLQSIRIMHTQIPTKSIGFICWQLIAGLFLYDLSVILNEGFPHWCKSNNVNLWFHEWKKKLLQKPRSHFVQQQYSISPIHLQRNKAYNQSQLCRNWGKKQHFLPSWITVWMKFELTLARL